MEQVRGRARGAPTVLHGRWLVHSNAARWRAGQFSGINGIGIHGAEIEFMRLTEPRRRAAGPTSRRAIGF